jgi:SAM-dependent methyltransferase
MSVLVRLPDRRALEAVCAMKYGPPERLGWGPQLRRDHDYVTPDDWYEALLASLVQPGVRWLDAGCGRDLFPFNKELAQILSRRCTRLAGVDPDPTLDENPYVHEKVRLRFDDYDGQGGFDLCTLRMVAEHIDDPERCLRSIERALAPGGVAVVYTVFGLSPIPLATRLVPMPVRHALKHFLWRTDAKDTFPTRFRMNTRGKLRRLFAGVGMREEQFLRLDDCRTFARFRWLLEFELRVRGLCRLLRVPYPEHCLVGIYRKP